MCTPTPRASEDRPIAAAVRRTLHHLGRTATVLAALALGMPALGPAAAPAFAGEAGSQTARDVASLTGGPAAAGEKAPILSTRSLPYEAYMGGMHSADFDLLLDGPGEGYDARFRLRTQGLTDFLFRIDLKAHSIGVRDGAGLLDPRQYAVDFSSRKQKRRIDITFDPESGAATPQIRTEGKPREEDRKKEDEIPPELRVDVIDPLSGLVDALHRVRHHVEEGGPENFRIKVYDGRHRFDLVGSYEGKATRTFHRKRFETHMLRLTADPLAGIEEKKMEMWEGSEFVLYLSTDGRYVPLQIDSIGPGPVITLNEECTRNACWRG